MAQVYDEIGAGYSACRQPDPRWSARIHAHLRGAHSILNVGAGAGSYEPAAARVVALEPSEEMIRQRPRGSAPVVRGRAERLPFPDRAFDAALAILTTHHWDDPVRGFDEMRRVSRTQLILTWDPEVTQTFWLVCDYLPEIADREAGLATVDAALANLPGAQVQTLPVPADCVDGCLGAYWRRPAMYLDAGARRSISGLALLDAALVASAMARLEADLDSGRWQARHGDLIGRSSMDLGYRLVIAGG